MKKAKPSETPVKPADMDRAILMLTSGMSRDAIEETAVAKMGLTPPDARRLVDAARRKLTLAANYNRDERLGEAITRLDDCYKKSLSIQDVKTCLGVQRELNKLLALYSPPPAPAPAAGDASAAGTGEAAAELRAELDAARRHLAPMFSNGEKLPLSELCRLAAGRILGR